MSLFQAKSSLLSWLRCPFFCHDVIILLHARREKKRPLEIFFHIKMPFSRALKMDMKTMKLFPPSAYFFAC